MKENKELEQRDIAVDPDMQIDCDNGQEIIAYLETWFGVDAKFGVHTNADDSAWLNMYARYNPFADTLRIECDIDTDDSYPNETFDYEPTPAETQLIKDMISQKIENLYGQTPQEFCTEYYSEEHTIGGIT